MDAEKTKAMFAALGRGETIETLYKPSGEWYPMRSDKFAGCPSAVPSMALIADWRVKREPVVMKGNCVLTLPHGEPMGWITLPIPNAKSGTQFSVVATEILDPPQLDTPATEPAQDLAAERYVLLKRMASLLTCAIRHPNGSVNLLSANNALFDFDALETRARATGGE